jgi:hypothetical protein
MKSTSVLVLGLCIAVTTVLVAQSPMRAGRWEVVMQMQMPNMPVQMPEMKTSQCITPEQLKDPASALPNGSPNATNNQACKVSDYKVSGNTVTWKVACSAPQTMTASGEMTVDGDSYVGTMKMTTPQGPMSMKMTGTRRGDCTQ